MKLVELFENIDNFDVEIVSFISDYLLALKANNIQKVPTISVINEIKKNKDIEIDFTKLSDIIKGNSLVQDMNKDFIILNIPDGIYTDNEEDSDTVKDMAKMAINRRMK